MTSRERLLTVLKRGVPDTVPIFIRGVSPFNEKMNWMGKHDPSYERLRRFVLEETDHFHSVGLDGGEFLSAADIEVTERVVREDDEWRDIERSIRTPLGPIRRVTRRSKMNLYEVMDVEHFIKDARDYERFMSLPYVPVRPQVREIVRRKEKEVGDHGLVAVGIPEVISYAHDLFGSEGLALWSVLHREKLDALFQALAARVIDYVRYILSEGAGPVLTSGGAELAVPPLMSPKDFHDFVTVVERPVHELAHSCGTYTWVHCHGKLDEVLEEFLEIGVDILEPVEAPPGGNVALADVKRRIGGQTILMGNMPYEAIISWPKERIEGRVKADCQAAMDGGGFIMMPAASPFESVLTDEAFEGFKTYVRAGRKYGRYGG
jgi:hypothetical protein